MNNQQIAREVGVGRVQVGRWRERFAQFGPPGIESDMPRSGRKPRIDRGTILRLTTQSKPGGGKPDWSTRKLATIAGISHSSVLRIWRSNGIKPHFFETFMDAHDLQFVEKFEDVIGLYWSPPEHALVLYCDEKSPGQTPDHTRPGSSGRRRRAGTMTHDDQRHGHLTLFAALNLLNGSVVARPNDSDHHHEWLTFLRQIDRETAKDTTLHLICDNYATHQHPRVRKWLEEHPRFRVHIVPTSALGLKMVERCFGAIITERLRRRTMQHRGTNPRQQNTDRGS